MFVLLTAHAASELNQMRLVSKRVDGVTWYTSESRMALIEDLLKNKKIISYKGDKQILTDISKLFGKSQTQWSNASQISLQWPKKGETLSVMEKEGIFAPVENFFLHIKFKLFGFIKIDITIGSPDDGDSEGYVIPDPSSQYQEIPKTKKLYIEEIKTSDHNIILASYTADRFHNLEKQYRLGNINIERNQVMM